jgi:DnaJ-class molecular chaperone
MRKRVCKPDTHPDPAWAASSATESADAYFVLHDPTRRREYDLSLEPGSLAEQIPDIA